MELQVAWIGFAGALLVAILSGAVQYWAHVDSQKKRRHDNAEEMRVGLAEWIVDARKAVEAGAFVLPARQSRLDGDLLLYQSADLMDSVAAYDDIAGSPPQLALALIIPISVPVTGMQAQAIMTLTNSQLIEQLTQGTWVQSEQSNQMAGDMFDSYRTERREWLQALTDRLAAVGTALRKQ